MAVLNFLVHVFILTFAIQGFITKCPAPIHLIKMVMLNVSTVM
jgi:hypothetical protein